MSRYVTIAAIIVAMLVVATIVRADFLVLDLQVGDTGQVNCPGELIIVSQDVSQINADCVDSASPTPTSTPEPEPTSVPPTPTSTPQPEPTPAPPGEELLTNWELYNAVDPAGELFCSKEWSPSAPFWDSEYFGFRGPWREDAFPDGCAARTMGENYPDNSSQINHIPAGETGTLWQVAQSDGSGSAIVLNTVYGQHESGSVHWSLWDCPSSDASVEQCTLIYRTDPAMRIPFLDTKECSAYLMTLQVATAGDVTWDAEQTVADCADVSKDTVTDTTAPFAMPQYIGVLFEVTPLAENPPPSGTMSGVKIGSIKLSLQQ